MAKKKSKGESPFTYFRKLFMENPHWLQQKSNDEVIARYRADHNLDENASIEKRVRDAMANTKSQLRKKLGEGDNGLAKASGKPGRKGGKVTASSGTTNMQSLEEQIDHCLALARNLDPSGLGNVIQLLRNARNEVIIKERSK